MSYIRKITSKGHINTIWANKERYSTNKSVDKINAIYMLPFVTGIACHHWGCVVIFTICCSTNEVLFFLLGNWRVDQKSFFLFTIHVIPVFFKFLYGFLRDCLYIKRVLFDNIFFENT